MLSSLTCAYLRTSVALVQAVNFSFTYLDETMNGECSLSFFSHNAPELFLVPFPVIPEQSKADSACNKDPCELQNLIQSQ